eukprot:10877948-Heterocapsa_arctica.AAC.1
MPHRAEDEGRPRIVLFQVVARKPVRAWFRLRFRGSWYERRGRRVRRALSGVAERAVEGVSDFEASVHGSQTREPGVA